MEIIKDYIVGISIGLILALVVVLLLKKLVFKDKNMGTLYLFIFVIFAGAGGIIQNKHFTLSVNAMPSPQEQIENITTTIEDTWKNTNGGFTFEQIKKAQEDSECPIYDDQIIGLKCYDFGSYIVFGFQDGNIFQNTVFYKSSDGLILDGIMNMHISMTEINWFYKYDLDSFKWVDNRNTEPNYVITHVPISWDVINGKYDNLLSVSRQTVEFLQYNYKFRTNKDEMTNFVMKNISTLTAQNITSNFIKFNDVELIGTANTGLIKINSFYNYLYEQVKGQNYNTNKLIDASNCLCLPIPKDMQTKYPISASKKAEYNNADYYGVYKCNIAVNLSYVQGNTTINSTTKNEDYIDTIKDDKNQQDKVTIEDIQPSYTYAKLSMFFVDSKNSDLTNLNLLVAPVKIEFKCEELNLTKTVLIDSIDKLNKSVNVLLSKDTTWSYFIDSEALIFDNFKGNFTLKSDSCTLSFSYYFLNNYTIASIGLNPVGTIDTSVIDLVKNPVKIILSNDKHTYQFMFNENTKLDTFQSMLVEMGDYEYTILSKQLIFASVTGKLTITSTDKVMMFNYALGVEDPIKFNITVVEAGTATMQYIRLYSDPVYVERIRENLSSTKVYLVTCVIYDKDGKLIENFTHTHSASGTCTDTWTAHNLVDGETYTLQLRFTDKNDSTITYLSDVANFTYETGTLFKVTYTVIENN